MSFWTKIVIANKSIRILMNIGHSLSSIPCVQIKCGILVNITIKYSASLNFPNDQITRLFPENSLAFFNLSCELLRVFRRYLALYVMLRRFRLLLSIKIFPCPQKLYLATSPVIPVISAMAQKCSSLK